MSITNIELIQTNIYNDCDLLPIHSPLVFIARCEYDGEKPLDCDVNLYDIGDNLLATYRGIELRENNNPLSIDFTFTANDFLSAYMLDFEDRFNEPDTLNFVENITKVFTVEFSADGISQSITFTAIHAASQFGETPPLENIYRNENLVFYGECGKYVDVYIYNDNENNNLGTEAGAEYAADEDLTVFTDDEGTLFKIDI